MLGEGCISAMTWQMAVAKIQRYQVHSGDMNEKLVKLSANEDNDRLYVDKYLCQIEEHRSSYFNNNSIVI